MTKNPSQQPWALLYNLESRLGQQPPPMPRRVGRPPAPIPRTSTMMEFTAEEKRTLQMLTSRIQQLFPSAKITRSQVAGFSFRLLSHLMDRAGAIEGAGEWDALWNRLIESEER